MPSYRRKQVGRASLGFAIFAIIWTALFLSHSPIPAMFTMLALAAMGFAFSSLTVEVDGREVRWWFAPRLLGRRLERSEIASVRPVRNSLWRGWGIRWVKGGWLYNVSGLEAVEIRLKNGRRVLLGTDRADELARALAPA